MAKSRHKSVNENTDNLQRLEKLLKTQEETISKLRQENAEQRQHVQYLQHELDKIRSLKSHIFYFIDKKIKQADTNVEAKLGRFTEFRPATPVMDDDNLLASARIADRENIELYNKSLEKNKSQVGYRKMKRAVRKLTKRES